MIWTREHSKVQSFWKWHLWLRIFRNTKKILKVIGCQFLRRSSTKGGPKRTEWKQPKTCPTRCINRRTMYLTTTKRHLIVTPMNRTALQKSEMADAKWSIRRETHQIINLVLINWKEHSRRLEISNWIPKSSCIKKILWGIYMLSKWATWFLQGASFRRMVYFIVWRNSNKKKICFRSKSRLKVQINWTQRMPQDLKQNSLISTSANRLHHRLMNKWST